MTDMALVTGAAGNLGRAVAAALGAQGWRVALLDRDEARLSELAAALPGAGHLVLPATDLTDAAACAATLAGLAARGARLRAVAHLVGGFAAAPIAAGGLAEIEPMFRLNLLTTAHVLAAAVPPLRLAGGGAMLAVGAAAGLHAPAGLAAYAAAKAGVLRLVEAMAAELAPDAIRVNALLPGTIDTPQNRAAMPEADRRGWVSTAQLAEAVVFLLSPAASGITGALLPVTGAAAPARRA